MSDRLFESFPGELPGVGEHVNDSMLPGTDTFFPDRSEWDDSEEIIAEESAEVE